MIFEFTPKNILTIECKDELCHKCRFNTPFVNEVTGIVFWNYCSLYCKHLKHKKDWRGDIFSLRCEECKKDQEQASDLIMKGQ